MEPNKPEEMKVFRPNRPKKVKFKAREQVYEERSQLSSCLMESETLSFASVVSSESLMKASNSAGTTKGSLPSLSIALSS